MGVADRKSRERIEREQRIIAAARMIAANEGWNAVTIRRLASEIEYSQPVLYSHFENREAIVAAVAVEGFAELAAVIGNAASPSIDQRTALTKVAMAYLDFASSNPALYEAMFTMPTGLDYATTDTRQELKDAFAALAAVVAPVNNDIELVTETFWATLHGLAALERSGRIRRSAREERVGLLSHQFLSH